MIASVSARDCSRARGAAQEDESTVEHKRVRKACVMQAPGIGRKQAQLRVKGNQDVDFATAFLRCHASQEVLVLMV